MDFRDIQNFKKDLLTLVKLDKSGEIKKIYQDFLNNEANGLFLKMSAEQMRRMEPDALNRGTAAISKLAGEIADCIEERLAPEEIMLVSGFMRTYSNRMRDMEAGYGRSRRESVSPISTDVEAMLENFKPLYQAENSQKAADMIVHGMGNDFMPYRMLASADKIERNMLMYAGEDGFENIMGEIDDLNCKFNIYTGISELQGQLKELKKLENTEKHELMNADYKEVGRMPNVARMEFRLESYKKALELGWPVRDLNTYARIDSYLRDHNGPELAQVKNILNAPLSSGDERDFYYRTFKTAFTNICAKNPDDRLAANVSMLIDKHINDVMSAGEIENLKPANKSRTFDIEYDENGMPVHDAGVDDPELDQEVEALENGEANREVNELEAERIYREAEQEVNQEQAGTGGAVEAFFANAGEENLNNEELGAEMENLEAQVENEENANNEVNDEVNENNEINENNENQAGNEEQLDNQNNEQINNENENANEEQNVNENGNENENVEQDANENENVNENNEYGQIVQEENVEQEAENNEVNENADEEEKKEEEKKEEKEKEEEKKKEEQKREEEKREEEKAEEEKEAEEAAEEKEPEIEKLTPDEHQGILDKLGDLFANVEELIDMNKEMQELGGALRKQNIQRDQRTFELLGTLAACERLGDNCTISEMKEAYGKLVVATNAYLDDMESGTYRNQHNSEFRELFEGIRDKAKEIFEGIDDKVLVGDEYGLEFDKSLSKLNSGLQEQMDTLNSEYEKYGGRIKKEKTPEELGEDDFVIEVNEDKPAEKKDNEQDDFNADDFEIEEYEDEKKEEEKKEEQKKEEPEKKEEEKKEEEPEKKEEEKKEEEPVKKEEEKKEEPYRVAVNVEGWGKEHFVYESKYSKKTNVETLKKEEDKQNKKEPKPDYGKLRMSKGTQIEIKAEKDEVMNNNKPLVPKNK